MERKQKISPCIDSPLTQVRPKFLWILERCKTSKDIKRPVSWVLFFSRCSALHSQSWSYAMFGISRTVCLLNFPLALLIYCFAHAVRLQKSAEDLVHWPSTECFVIHTDDQNTYRNVWNVSLPTCMRISGPQKLINRVSVNYIERSCIFFHVFLAHKILQMSLVLLEMVEFLTVKLDTAPTSSGLAGFTVNVSSPSTHSKLALEKFSSSTNMLFLFFSVSRYILKEHPVPRVFPRKATLQRRSEGGIIAIILQCVASTTK